MIVAALVGPGVRHKHRGGNQHHHHGHSHHHDEHTHHTAEQVHIHVLLLGVEFTLPDWVGSTDSPSLGRHAEFVDVLGPLAVGQLLGILFALLGHFAAAFLFLELPIFNRLAPFSIGTGIGRSAPPAPPPRRSDSQLAFNRFR